ncbi:MAG: YqcC family protein [Proteobacteria bacterium]|nr:MAG: YqcC family protein [Pseudomonadota bacterium]QKK11697.1 MAG: YqcC family protein [Pseudomonadota bacterium]
MRHREEIILQITDAIEGELRRLELWELHTPAPEALLSEQPFCFDTLTFTQWLQWIFLVRVRKTITNGLPLPTRSDIHPLAEHVFADLDFDSAALLKSIKRFDRAISQSPDDTGSP